MLLSLQGRISEPANALECNWDILTDRVVDFFKSTWHKVDFSTCTCAVNEYHSGVSILLTWDTRSCYLTSVRLCESQLPTAASLNSASCELSCPPPQTFTFFLTFSLVPVCPLPFFLFPLLTVKYSTKSDASWHSLPPGLLSYNVHSFSDSVINSLLINIEIFIVHLWCVTSFLWL